MTDSATFAFNREKLAAIREREDKQFRSRTPRSAELHRRASKHMPGGVPMSWHSGFYRTAPIFVDRGEGAQFFDVDGNNYLDFNVCDLSMTMGYGSKPIVEAVAKQVARGAQFLLPTEDAIAVSEILAERTNVPAWQFTLSASGANTEVLRIARFMTGRSKVLVFGGHYHGNIDETLVHTDGDIVEPGMLGLPSDAAANTIVVPFNSIDALENALKEKDVALVLTEPALTNCNVIMPESGYLSAVRELTLEYGSMLCLDEAHTFQFAYGGLVGDGQLETDFVVLGKGLGSGIGFGLYGMSAAIADVFEKHIDVDIGPTGIATGGTLYGNAIALAAAKAALVDVLTVEAYDRASARGEQLADGLDQIFANRGLPWMAFRLGPRSGYCLSEKLPIDFDEAKVSLDYDFIDTRRAFMANRGIWDAIASAGPQISFVHSEEDVNSYLAVADQFLDEMLS